MASEFGFGTLVSNASNVWGTGNKLRQKERGEQHADYLRREREGIVARVEGAKAAGLHPLVAMGYQASAGPSTVLGGDRGPANMGMENLGQERAPVAPGGPPGPTEDEERISKANVRIAEARAEEAEVAAHNAIRALANQPGQAIPIVDPEGNMYTNSGNLQPGLRRGVKLEPDKVTASRGPSSLPAALTAGIHPGGTEFKVPVGKHGRTIRLPSGKLAESLEDQEILKNIITLQMNSPAAWDAIKNDVPWAVRGYLQDLRKAVGLPPTRKSRRGSGATGSW